MDIKTELLFALLRVSVCENALTPAQRELYSAELLPELLKTARKQDVAHLLVLGLKRSGLIGEENAALEQMLFGALYRYESIRYEYTRICDALEKAKLPFIPLKGSVIRKFYPEPWMRNSCDIDILVREEELDRAIRALEENLQYTAGVKGDHDISLYCPSGVHLELHFDTIQERYAVSRCRDILSRIWEFASPEEAGSCRLLLTDEMFYFYHIAHMTKHFQNGGCGIRPFLDIWILNHKMPFDRIKREKLLDEGGLLSFARSAEKLSEVWFSGAAPDAMDLAVSDYILRGGVYGNTDNRAAIGQAKNGGKLKYLLTRRVFMPYDYLKAEYPILKKHKWLFPLYQAVRWAAMLLRGGLGRTCRELKANLSAKAPHKNNAEDILKYMGL